MSIFLGCLAVSIVLAVGMLVYGLAKGKTPHGKPSFFFFLISLIIFLSIFECHECRFLVPNFPLVNFFLFSPLLVLGFLFFVVHLINASREEKHILIFLTVNTCVYTGIVFVNSLDVFPASFASLFFFRYAIVTSIAGLIMGLYWCWRKFRDVTELVQARVSVFFMASLAVVISLAINSVLYPHYNALWSFALLVPYAGIVLCVFLNKHIIFLEKLLQEVFLKATILAVYSGSYALIVAVFEQYWRFLDNADIYRFFFEAYLLVIILTYRVLDVHMKQMYERMFFRPRFNFHLLFRNFSQALLSMVDTDQIVRMVVTMFSETYALESVSCFMYDAHGRLYRMQACDGEEPGRKQFSAEHRIVELMRERYDVVTRARLRSAKEREVLKLLSLLRAEVCVPFQYRDTRLGFLFLGPKKDGTPFTDEDLELFNVAEGQITVAMNNAHFIRAQKESYELMAQKNKMDAVIALSGGVNHEINNPLSIISMKSQNFLRRIRDNKFGSKDEAIQNATDIIESCLRNAGRAHLITRRLGDFAKPAKGSVELETIDVGVAVRACVELIGEKQLAHDNINVSIAVDEGAEYVLCDKSHVQQILFNIIMNAYHAIGENGTITIHSKVLPADRVSIDITDTGSGIKAEELEKIWEPFFTTKPQQQLAGTKVTGSGLGLALVKRYVEHVGGSIAVESTVDRGTTFSVCLKKAHKPQ